jgi:amino acid adenylation domain-containing protein
MKYLLWHRFADQAQSRPNACAILDGRTVTTYAELDSWSGRLTGVLQSAGLGRGSRVGLLAPKSARGVAAMLGASRAGCAYVPVDPSAPAARSAYILGNAAVRALFTTRRHLTALAAHAELLANVELVVLLDEETSAAESWAATVVPWAQAIGGPTAAASADSIESDPAYILYTSGSTGTPKGVVISHRNALAFIDWAREEYAVSSDDVLSSHAPFHFDLSVFDLYAALHSGATVALIPGAVATFPYDLARWIDEVGITIWYSVPSALIRLLRQGELERFEYRRLHTVLFAGEVFPVRHLRDVMDRLPQARFHNLYGPTETNVCTHHPVPRPLVGDEDLPIGRPCANYDAFVLADSGVRAAAGEEGELLVRGPGVMPGYWGLPERTAESLIQNPLHTDFVDLVYRTGDIVRADSDGRFRFLGRRDHMVKTRGYRVELGEIEHALHQHPSVAAAAVVAIADDEIGARLEAWVAAEDGLDIDASELVAFCRTLLPTYAVPEAIHVAADLPRTSTGKIDRKRLSQAPPAIASS